VSLFGSANRKSRFELLYTHVSDQYAPFHTKVINATVRDATHVLDGLLYHESDLCIEEHYTDTAGFTDHVFALCHLLGFRFAPRSHFAIRHPRRYRRTAYNYPSETTQDALYRLGVYTREQLPQAWAMTQNNLGITLWAQAARTEGPKGAELLAQAVSAYRSALEVYSAEAFPLDHDRVQQQLKECEQLGVSPTKVRKVPQDFCQQSGRKGFSANPELP
jgi:Tn3 transposase DDE domain